MLRPDPDVSIEQKFHNSLGLPAVKGADGFHNIAADFDSASHRSEPRTLLLRARRHDLGYGSPEPCDSDRHPSPPDVFHHRQAGGFELRNGYFPHISD